MIKISIVLTAIMVCLGVSMNIASGEISSSPKSNSYYPANKAPLAENAYSPLPLGAVKPNGWLKTQLQIQADGLSGHLPEFWPSLGPENGWLGGDGDPWERGPYYTDGLVPLAFLTGDKKLIEMAHKWVGWTLENQAENGWIGPVRNEDWWPAGPMLKALTQYYEFTGDPRVIQVMQKFFECAKNELPARPLHSWAKFRWADTAINAIWLYNRTGDPELLEVANLMMKQGLDYADLFTNFKPYEGRSPKWTLESHVVNAAMGVKTPCVMWELTGNQKYRKAIYTAIDNLDKFHGQAAGIFSGDECLAGKNPSQGTELCAVVEYMFSLEVLMKSLGDPAFGDRLEKIAYNALPAPFSPDMWAHQYDQQANQVMCKWSEDNWWTTNLADSGLYGLEPNCGCCTANMHQGWPKFVSHLWMATPDDGLAAVAYGPCVVSAKVKGDVPVTITVDTDYPFDEIVCMSFSTPKSVKFPLQLRIPDWAEDATISINGKAIDTEPGTFATVDRVWEDGDKLNLRLPMKIRIERRFNNSATILRGPLVYSLKIGEEWTKVAGEEPHADYQVMPTTPWNYGLILDMENPEKSITVKKKSVGKMIYSSDTAPIELHVKGRIVPEWKEEHAGAGMLPVSPVKSSEPIQDLVLIPYGCAKLRVTEFPVLDE